MFDVSEGFSKFLVAVAMLIAIVPVAFLIAGLVADSTHRYNVIAHVFCTYTSKSSWPMQQENINLWETFRAQC